MKVLWICGLPNEVRLSGFKDCLSPVPTAAWSWILGHLPPPNEVELHVLCPVRGLIEPEVHFDYQGAHWHCFRQKRFEQLFLWFRFLWTIRPFVRRLSPDIIQGWGGETGCGWIATWLTRNAIVSVQGLLRLCDDMMRKSSCQPRRGPSLRVALSRFLECKAYHRASRLLVESETSGKALSEYYGEDAVVVPHPLRTVFLTGDVLRKEDSRDVLRVLFVGRMDEGKGPMDAVGAVAALNDETVKLTMVGSGPLLSNVQNAVASYGLEPRVTIRPVCSASEVCDLMAQAHVYLLPSYGDTGPTTLKEALSQGCAAICYNNTGPKELLTRYGGFLAQTGDRSDLLLKLREAVEVVRGNENFGRDIAYKVRCDLSRDVVWNRLVDIYGRLNGGGRK